MDYIKKIAKTNNTILITGKTGTGKSFLAKDLHAMSNRSEKKIYTINLATLSESLIESELFGHEKGAFSGADVKRVGKLESANSGTVFLDEIGELSPRMQLKLLDALNNQVISPVGSNREIQLDIRIIAATNKNLQKMVADGLFREDLFFRINTFEISLPELSADPERICTLAKKFILEASIQQNKQIVSFSNSFFDDLKSYAWPGNIRELKNAMDFAVAMSSDNMLATYNLPPQVLNRSLLNEVASNSSYLCATNYREAKQNFEKFYLKEILNRFEGKINLTARKTGLSKVTLIEKIKRYEINVQKIKFNAYEKSERRFS